MIAKIIYTSLFTVVGYSLTLAQSFFVENGQVLSISAGASLTIPELFLNQGFVINQGIIRLEENWINQSSYSGDGCIELVGADDQNVQHAGQSFGTLKIENEGLKILESSITVDDTLTLNNGILASTTSNILRLAADAVVENASELSYVQGPIQYEGSGYKYLPLGTENGFFPIELSDVKGVNPILLVEAIDTESFQVNGERLEEKEVGIHWTIDVVNGAYDGSIIKLPVSREDGFDDLSGVVVAQSDDLAGEFDNLGQSNLDGNADDGKVTSSLVATGPFLTLGLTTEYSLENSVEIASAFAPDATNSVNREIKVYAKNLVADNFSFVVFNRWGQIVYQTTVLNEATTVGWNGIDQESKEPAPAGVYSYLLRGRFESNRAVEKTGSITLFR